MDAFWIILTGALVAVNGGLIGCFLVLKKMAMVGDAISHAVLPGIVIAFLLTGSLSSIPVLLGATLIGIFCTFLIEIFNKKAQVQADASIGLTFTFLFATGVILIALYGSNTDLDQECVLYGEIAFIGFNTLMGIPQSIWILGATSVLLALLLSLGYKGLVLTTFDPDFAKSIGVATGRWHYLLMAAVSLITVVSFESVGAILVVAFLTAPAAIAYLLSDSLKRMLAISALAGIIASLAGYYLAVYLNSSISGAMTAVLAIEFLMAWFISRYRSKGILIPSPGFEDHSSEAISSSET